MIKNETVKNQAERIENGNIRIALNHESSGTSGKVIVKALNGVITNTMIDDDDVSVTLDARLDWISSTKERQNGWCHVTLTGYGVEGNMLRKKLRICFLSNHDIRITGPIIGKSGSVTVDSFIGLSEHSQFKIEK